MLATDLFVCSQKTCPKHVGRSSLVAMGKGGQCCLALSLLAVAPVPEPVERPKRSLLFGSFSQHPWIYIPDAVKLSLACFVLCGPDPFWIFGLFDTWCPLSLSKWGLHGSISVFPHTLSLSLKLFVYPSVNLQEVLSRHQSLKAGNGWIFSRLGSIANRLFFIFNDSKPK